MPSMDSSPMSTALPSSLVFADGSPVAAPRDWPRRRREIEQLLLDVEYGPLPPAPAHTRAEMIIQQRSPRLPGTRHLQYRLVTEPSPACTFILDLLIPDSPTPLPVIIDGDGCWLPPQEVITSTVMQRRFILAQFNRCEIVPDVGELGRSTGLHRACPELELSALAAWAWGYHRCVDHLLSLPYVDPAQIAVVGHSRGGKTSLLAGATDPRIALTAANNSGCGGAGCFRFQAPGSETIKDITTSFPHWFAPRLNEYAGREDQLPIDQHDLKALVAPRLLLTIEAIGDLWANPRGTWLTHAAARQVYRFLDATDHIGIVYRPGGHAHTLDDWAALMDFADLHFRGIAAPRGFNECPYSDLPADA